MYTGLRFEAKLKPFVADAMSLIISDDNRYSEFWSSLAGIISIDPNWLKVGRRDFIPYGGLSYMPDDWNWSNDIGYATQKWSVCCSLKNYEGEIETFLELVMPFLIEDYCEVEVLYEEWDKPKIIGVDPKPVDQMKI